MKKQIIFLFLSLLGYLNSNAQDPHFSQYFMAPQFVNPAIIGSNSADWRLMCNWRQQWGNAGTPYNTQSMELDTKILGKQTSNDIVQNTLAIGGGLMLDQSMYGAFKSTYALGTVAYHAHLTENQTIGLGIQAMYANRTIDYSRLTFGEQFTSGGFDVTLPSGEKTLIDKNSYLSLSAGLLYTFNNDVFNVNAGFSAFHLNKPKQTFLKDPKQILPIRYVAHINTEFYASDRLSVNLNGCYQEQALPAYFAIGGALGWDANPEKTSTLYAGAWFREGDSFYPYAGWLINNVQVGFSYDITHSKQDLGPSVPRSFEVSLVITKKDDPERRLGTGCPNKPW